ncbi:hypothetical protein FAZ69_07760 [Trinickia terrae]|uniref:Uncharacterized protein n=1 Tax=Trinickia terrae TaxID=2571161 RepID=A0A4U1I981_9BURK|nr:hypothetical protein [Trinickia terrae]TKC90051.1 hypothetical protein FAZ69_07760 [Trinickia terrae]
MEQRFTRFAREFSSEEFNIGCSEDIHVQRTSREQFRVAALRPPAKYSRFLYIFSVSGILLWVTHDVSTLDP